MASSSEDPFSTVTREQMTKVAGLLEKEWRDVGVYQINLTKYVENRNISLEKKYMLWMLLDI